MLPVPHHIAGAAIAKPDLQFPWDEWNVKSYYWDVSQALFDRLDALSDDASISLALAIGEWVVHRFDSLSQDPQPLQFIEAAWAGTVHPAYCVYTETVDDEWRGPVRGPLAVTIAIANDGLFCRADDPEVATRACWMHRLARHVLPDTSKFDLWFEAVVKRLETTDARGEEVEPVSFFGKTQRTARPVPRDAFDLAVPYSRDRATLMVDSFLRSLVPEGNPYLRGPAELAAISEFDSQPYRFFG